MSSSSLNSVIPQAKQLYYAGKHNEAFSLLQTSMKKIEGEDPSLDDNTHSQMISLSNEMERTSLYFAVQSIFLHNISATTTIELITQKLSNQEQKSLPDETFIHDLKDLLGLAYYYQEMTKVDKDFSDAETHINQALTFREQSGSDKLAYSYFHKGLVLQYSGQFNEALDSFRQANKLSQQDAYLLSFITRHLGFLLQQAGKLEQAKELFENSLQLRLDNGLMVYVPFSCITLADCYRDMNQTERAIQLLEKAVEIGELIQQDRALALAHLSLGQYYELQKSPEQTLESYLSSYYYGRKINHLGIIKFISDKIQLKPKQSED